ncbi:MAG: GatB/YqeY domain-containing protein [Erysipelotrichaceae bacterium]|nr:GatB/YqeY domain-containing protein [Erysipelotrichaceae bacterium]
MKQRIMEDLKSAMKSGDKERLSVIRMLKGAIQMEEIAKMHELTDEEIVPIIAKQIKTRKEANVEFAKANRNDLVDKNNAEIEILNTYMPRMVDEAEINLIIDQVFAKINPTSSNDIGKIMKEIAPQVRGKADMSLVNSLIKSRLENL